MTSGANELVIIMSMLQQDHNEESSKESFFLPDFCSVQTLFMMVLVAQLIVLVLELYSRGIDGFTWVSLGLSSFFAQWLILLSAGLLCNMKGVLQRLPMRSGAFVCYFLIVILIIAFSILSDWALRVRLGQDWDWQHIISNVIICSVLAGIALRYLYLQQQLRAQQQAELKARIDALQSRIRPHFLFNSMNIIASLIEVDPRTAERVVEDLSDLFRVSLEVNNAEVDFIDELDLCRKYVGIEQLRLGSRLQVQWDIEGIPDALKIPSLVLQPLLENAIYHGIQPLPEGGLVQVRGKLQDEHCMIEVTNPVADEGFNDLESGSAHQGHKMATDNIRNRLLVLYGPEAFLKMKSEAGFFSATLSYPASKPKDVLLSSAPRGLGTTTVSPHEGSVQSAATGKL